MNTCIIIRMYILEFLSRKCLPIEFKVTCALKFEGFCPCRGSSELGRIGKCEKDLGSWQSLL